MLAGGMCGRSRVNGTQEVSDGLCKASAGLVVAPVVAKPEQFSDLADQRHPRVSAITQVLECVHRQLRQSLEKSVLGDAGRLQGPRHLQPVKQLGHTPEQSAPALLRLASAKDDTAELCVLLRGDVCRVTGAGMNLLGSAAL